MKRKKIASFLTAVLLLLSMLPFAAGAANETGGALGDNLTWTLADGALTISGEGEMPPTQPVHDASGHKLYPWGYYRQSITAVTIENGVTSIGWDAFCYCTNLTSITIPDSVTTIGSSAFYDTAYYDDTANWENGVLYIGTCLIDVDTSISGTYTVTADTSCIADGAFYGCTGLTAIHVDAANTAYTSENGVLFNKDKTELLQYPAGKTEASYAIPDSVTNIGWYVFEGCTNLTSITIPGSVTSIGDWAFYGCDSLTSVTLLDGVTTIGYQAFEFCDNLTSITIPSSVTSKGWYAFSYCTSLKSIHVDAANTAYTSENGVLFNKDKTELLQYPLGKTDVSYTIPDSVTSIAWEAFSGCTGLKSITIPGSVTVIDWSAYGGCDSLTSVTILDGVTNITWGAFSRCDSLTSITIPSSVTTIEEGAFEDCKNLTIHGVAGSYAETYAKENDIPFVAIGAVKLESANKEVTVSGAAGAVPSGAVLKAEPKQASTVIITDSSKDKYNLATAAVFNIYLEKDGKEIQPGGKVRVSIAVPKGLDGAKCRVLHIDANGRLTDMNAAYENGCMVFETDHFSLYAIAEAKAADNTGNTGNTGNANNTNNTINTGVAAPDKVKNEKTGVNSMVGLGLVIFTFAGGACLLTASRKKRAKK